MKLTRILIGYLSALVPPAVFRASVLCVDADVSGEICSLAGDLLFSYITVLLMTFVPVLVIVWLALHFEWRSVLPFVIAGGLLGLLVALALAMAESASLLLVLGAIFGLVSGSIFWVIACRHNQAKT